MATRAKSDFLASMSHELRTPLNSVIGFAGVLKAGLAGPLNEEQQRQIKMIGASGERLLGLVNQVLDLSRMEAGEFEPEYGEVDVADVSRHSLSVVSPIALAKGLDLRSDIPDEPLMIVSDRTRIDQVLLNLLGNAIKFTDEGWVLLRSRSDDFNIVLEVEDTGLGIPDDQLPFVFDRFYQIAPEQGGKHEGTGLGLSVTRQLVESLGGRVDVESRIGKGTVFRVTLPRNSLTDNPQPA